MPFYHHLGKIPPKRHTVFKSESGAFYYEELIGNKGFTGPASLMYHLHRPTRHKAVRLRAPVVWEADADLRLRPRHLRLHRLPAGGSPVLDRRPVLFNRDVAVSFAQPDRVDDFFYRNAQGDELIFVAEGGGRLESALGTLACGRATTSSSRAG